MTKFDHHNCEFFDALCRKRGLSPRRIRESPVKNAYRPDFALQINGKTVMVEVKTIEANTEEKRKLEKMKQGKFPVTWSGQPGDRIPKLLRKANKQLRHYVKRNIPGIVCLFDDSGAGHLYQPVDIHAGMFGIDAIQFKINRINQNISDARLKSGGRETLTQEHNKSISAVLVFPKHNQCLTRLYHNHFALCPIPPDCAAGFVDYQYKSGLRERPLGAPWISIGG